MKRDAIQIEQRAYSLAEGRSVVFSFFPNEDRFRHVVEDHVLNTVEPWERLIGVKFRRSLCQKIDSGEVSQVALALKDAYDKCVAVLDESIAFSIALPVYAEFKQRRHRLPMGNEYVSHGFFFLSRDGLLIVVRDDVVRTARFVTGAKPANLSKQTLFKDAWRYVKSRADLRYVDTKDKEMVEAMGVTYNSPENWTICPKAISAM